MRTIQLPARGDRDRVSARLQRTFHRPDAAPRSRSSRNQQLPSERGPAPEKGLRRVGGFALLALAPATIAAVALHPPHDFGVHSGMLEEARAHQDAWIAAHLLFLAGTILLVVAFLALASIVRDSRPRLAAVALGSALVGMVGPMGFLGLDLAIWQMAAPGADLEQMAAVVERVEASVAIGFPLYGLSAALGLGVALLLNGLVRCDAVSARLAIAVGLGLGLGFGFGSEPMLSLAGVGMAIPGVVWMGLRLARDPENLVTRRRGWLAS